MSIALAIRRANGQTMLAARLGVTQQYISLWLRRDYVPARYVKQVAEIGDVPPSTLLHPKLREALK